MNESQMQLVGMRDDAIDIVKGLAIMGIVLGHIGVTFPAFKLFHTGVLLYSMWHVAVFFVLSGFFLNDEKLKKPWSFTIGKVKSLYLKTLCFYIPAVLLHNILIKIGFYSVDVNYGGKKMVLYSGLDFVKKIIESVLLAGREPIVGPLWFAYVLFIALVGYSILSFFIGKFFKDEQYWIVKGLFCFALAMVSSILTQKYSLTLNRLSNSVAVMLLIFFGQLFNVRLRLSYKSGLFAIGAALLFFHEVVFHGGISLNNNAFNGVFHLLCGGVAATYMLLYMAKKIEHNFLGMILSLVGRHSFAIMALHLLSFKICTMLLNGCFGMSIPLAELVPGVGKEYVLAIPYLLIGTFVPVFVAWLFCKIKGCAILRKKEC